MTEWRLPDWLRPDRLRPDAAEADGARRARNPEATVLFADHAVSLDGALVPLVIRRLPHARRMTLRLAPDGSEVRLSIPRWCPTAEAVAFVESRVEWLEAQLARLPQAAPPAPDGMVPYRGVPHRIEHDPALSRRVERVDQILYCGGPADSLPSRLRRWLEGEARHLLAEDLADYCGRADLPLARLSLANAQRRWGSCSGKGDIRINWRLVMAPDFVRRSVVAHEVAHLVHFDHSPRFHALLAELYEGEIARADRWLKREGRSLYAPFG